MTELKKHGDISFGTASIQVMMDEAARELVVLVPVLPDYRVASAMVPQQAMVGLPGIGLGLMQNSFLMVNGGRVQAGTQEVPSRADSYELHINVPGDMTPAELARRYTENFPAAIETFRRLYPKEPMPSGAEAGGGAPSTGEMPVPFFAISEEGGLVQLAPGETLDEGGDVAVIMPAPPPGGIASRRAAPHPFTIRRVSGPAPAPARRPLPITIRRVYRAAGDELAAYLGRVADGIVYDAEDHTLRIPLREDGAYDLLKTLEGAGNPNFVQGGTVRDGVLTVRGGDARVVASIIAQAVESFTGRDAAMKTGIAIDERPMPQKGVPRR